MTDQTTQPCAICEHAKEPCCHLTVAVTFREHPQRMEVPITVCLECLLNHLIDNEKLKLLASHVMQARRMRARAARMQTTAIH